MRRPPPSQGSLFSAIVTTVGSHEPNARLQKIDVALGFIGFFVLFSVVRTAASTLQGAPSRWRRWWRRSSSGWVTGCCGVGEALCSQGSPEG